MRLALVLTLMAVVFWCGAASAGFIMYDGDEAGYRAALTSYGLNTTLIGFDDLAKDDLVTTQYLGLGVEFVPGNGGANFLRVDDEMNDVPPISNPYAIQIENTATTLTEFTTLFGGPIQTLAFWQGDVAKSGGNVLRIKLYDGANEVTTLNFTNSKDVSRFAGIIATGGDTFDSAWIGSMKLDDAWGFDNFEFQVVPEPSTMTALAFVCIGMAGAFRRKRS
jgi:hypothetical protein